MASYRELSQMVRKQVPIQQAPASTANNSAKSQSSDASSQRKTISTSYMQDKYAAEERNNNFLKYKAQFNSDDEWKWYTIYSGKNSDDLLKMMDGLEDGNEKTWLQGYTSQVYQSELPNVDIAAAKRKLDGMERILDSYRKNTRFVTDDRGEEWLAEINAKFGGEKGLEQAISRERQRIQLATREQDRIRNESRFNAVTGNADFAEKSVFDPNNNEIGYRYINGDDWERYLLDQQYGQYAEEFGYHAYDSLSDEEKSVYNYYMNTGDRQSAADYLRYVQDPLNKRKAQAVFEDGYKGNAALEMVYGIEAGLDQFRSGVTGFGAMIRGEDSYASPSATQYASSLIREDLGNSEKKLPEFLGGGTIGQAVYDSVTTAANMAPSILASTVIGLINPVAGSWVGGAMMGASAGGSAYQEMVNNGYSVGQARLYGSMVGAAEIIMEKLLGGIGKLGSNSSLAQQIARWAGNVDNAFINLVGRIGGNAFSEGLEEGIQEVVSGWLQSQITKEDFYAAPADVLYSSLLGAVTGALFEAPNASVDVGHRVSQGRDVIQAQGTDALVQMGRESENADVRGIAERTAKKPSAYNVGGLRNQVSSDIHSQNVKDISKKLSENGMRGKDADQMAEVIARVLEDGSEADIRLLASETDPIVAKTMRQVQMKGTAFNQRMQQLRGATGQSRSISQVAAAYGNQANEVKAAYIPGQDVETFAYNFERASTLGREGGNVDALEQVAPDMAASQRLSAYNIGRDAAAAEKAAANKRTTGEASQVHILNEDGSLGDAVRIEGLESTEGGKRTYRLSDGQTVSEDQLSFSGDQAVLDTVKDLGLDKETASVMIRGNNYIAQPDTVVAQGIEDAYRYGRFGYSMERLLKDSDAASVLREEMRKAAYEAGKNNPEKAKAKPTQANPRTKGKTPGVYFDNGRGQVQTYDLKSINQLDDKRKAGVQTAVVLQKLGISTDFYFFASYEKNGKRVYLDENGVERPAPNGWYDKADGSIHIDLNAGNEGQGLTLFTMAHELTHFIEQWSQDKYKVLADFLIRNYEKNRSVDELVKLKQADLSAGRDKPVSYEEAYSEVIADSMEAMLSDGNVLEKLAELKQQDEGLVRKMKAFFDRFVKKIRSIYADLKPESAEGQLVLEMKEKFEQLQQLFAEALADAGENYRNAAEVGMEVDTDTESVAPMVQMSERTWRESDYVQARDEAAKEISAAIGVTEEKARSYIDDVNSIAKMIAEDRTRLGTFDRTNPDIRYQDRPSAPITNRALLVDALESTTQDEIELTRLREYRMSIEHLNEQEAKLADLRRQIKEISFSKGPRDTAKLKQLQDEATKTANRINIYDKKLLKLESTAALQRVLEREKKKAYTRAQEHNKEVLSRQKEGRNKTALKKKIQGTIHELDKIFSNGTKQRNVKQGMRDFAATALASAEVLFADTYSNEDMVRSGVSVDVTAEESQLLHETQQLLKERDQLYNEDAVSQEIEQTVSGDLESYKQRMAKSEELDLQISRNMRKLKGVFERERNRLNSATVTELLNNLAAEYRKLGSSDDMYIRAVTDENVYQHLLSLAQNTDGTLVKDMTQDQLLALHKAFKMVLTTIRNANKAFVDGRSVESEARQLVQELEAVKVPKKATLRVLRNLGNAVGWNYEKLHYALERINSPALTRLFGNLADSENITMRDIQEAKTFQMEMVEKYHYNDWDVEKRIDHSFLDNNGKEFRLTLGQLMALYAYTRRENTGKHIEYGGFKIGKAALTDPAPATTYKLTEDQCRTITGMLTADQKSFAETMQKYLSETMGAKGNEVSMKLYGIEMFGEENYFPLHIAGEYKAQAQESQAKAQAGFQTMSNAGFTKSRNQNATAPIVLEDFMEVWVDHVNEMSRYHGAVPALEDIRRVMNYSVYSDATNESISVDAAMTNAYGKQAVEYFDNLYREANSGAITDKMDAVPKKLLSLFRKNAVAYSLSVVIQQPASIYRARALVDRKYFGKHGFFSLTGGVLRIISRKKWNTAYDEMMKYAPGVTMAKEIGGFDTSTGSSIRGYLLDTEKSFAQSMKHDAPEKKLGSVLGLVDNNPIASLPEVADKLAWIEMWEACKRETVAKNPRLQAGSEEFFQKVGERFTEVIRATQVYDSMFSKSPMLKSKNLFVQSMVSFMNEPNTVANMAEAAVRDLTRGKPGKAAKTAGALVISIAVTNILKSLVYALRDDDEDKDYTEKYISAVAGNLMSDVNILNYIPFVRDAVSVYQGYDVERSDMSIVSDAINAIRKLNDLAGQDLTGMSESELEEWDKACDEAKWRVAETLSPLFGIPLKNIRRDVLAVVNTVKTAGTVQRTRTGVKYALQEGFGGDAPGNDMQLYIARRDGDTEHAARVESRYDDADSADAAVRSAIRELYMDGEIDLKTARNHLVTYAGMKVDEAHWTMDEWKHRKENGNTEDYGKYEALYAAVRSGDNLQGTVKTYLDNGIKEETLRSQLSEEFHDEYMEASDKQREDLYKKLLEAFQACGLDQEEAEDKMWEWDFEAEYGFAWADKKKAYYEGKVSPKKLAEILVDIAGYEPEDAAAQVEAYDWEAEGLEDATYSRVKNYNLYCKNVIDRKTYLKLMKFSSETENDKDENGESIRYTAVEKIMAEMKRLGLSKQQKEAMANCFGWGKSTINYINRNRLW